ncbi:MAG: hypothetical protein ACE5I1_33390 [bacterium]
MIHIIRKNATQEQIAEMSQEYCTIIKLAVDIQRKSLAVAVECTLIVRPCFSKMAVARKMFGAQIGFLQLRLSSLKR